MSENVTIARQTYDRLERGYRAFHLLRWRLILRGDQKTVDDVESLVWPQKSGEKEDAA